MVMITGVRFKAACKVYDFDSNGQDVVAGDKVIVEVDRGLGLGTVSNGPEEKDFANIKHRLKKVIRKADDVDIERQDFNQEREKEARRVCREKIAQYGLDMKLSRVEYLFDSSKAIFYFTSEGRIDFRALVRDLASTFHTRIEMRQIGVRDEAKILGGLGPCGRELCCSNFLVNFAPVTVKMAKEQNLALNPSKISGICGRLMCCLSYEHETYKERKACASMAKAACGAGAKDGKSASEKGEDASDRPAPRPRRNEPRSRRPEPGSKRPESASRRAEAGQRRPDRRPGAAQKKREPRPGDEPSPLFAGERENKSDSSATVEQGVAPAGQNKPEGAGEGAEGTRPPRKRRRNRGRRGRRGGQGAKPTQTPDGSGGGDNSGGSAT